MNNATQRVIKNKLGLLNLAEELKNAGYQFNTNILIESGLFSSFSDNIFGAIDSYDLFQFQMLVRYSIKLHEKLILTPKVGVSYWELTSEDGEFLNSGPEAVTEISNRDRMWLLDFKIPVNRLVHLYLSYSESNFKFGQSDVTKFGVKFEF